MKALQTVGAAALLFGASIVQADEARTQAEQRVRLATRLISDSPSAQRIVASGDAKAVSHLDEGRLMLSLAQDALKGGDHAKARKAADEALHHLGMARRMVPDAPARQHAQRARHEQQLASAERLVEAWRERAGSGGGDGLLEATGLLQSARALGESERYDEGLALLARVEQRLLAGIGRVLGGREINYTMRPADAVEALRLEHARHAALSELVPLALRDLQPRPEARALINRYLVTARSLQAQAERHRDAGEVSAAVAALRSASTEVERALAAAGVITPPLADAGARP